MGIHLAYLICKPPVLCDGFLWNCVRGKGNGIGSRFSRCRVFGCLGLTGPGASGGCPAHATTFTEAAMEKHSRVTYPNRK